MDSTVNLGLYNGDNNLCRIFSGPLVAFEDSCVIPACLNVNQNYCYKNDDDAWFVYQSTDPNNPITLNFLQGDLLVEDKIVVYNGPYDQSAVLFNGNLGGDLTGFAISSQNPDNIITLRVQANSTASCLDGQATNDMLWDVGCGGVGIDEVNGEGFSLYPNPTNGTITVQLGSDRVTGTLVRLLDLSGRVIHAEPVRTLNERSFQLDLGDVQNGNYFLQLSTDQWVKTQAVQVAR
ncbi:MAG: T9SS type A sorting domain-containing protein [Flavobacteriales bacterium]|nr:T9SS type A sorting domain-containing protein [Flavobacteriales bacterium]